jgi:hypothetical protein
MRSPEDVGSQGVGVWLFRSIDSSDVQFASAVLDNLAAQLNLSGNYTISLLR